MNCGTEAVTVGAIRRGWSALLLAACLGLPMTSIAQVAPRPTAGQDQPTGGLIPPTSASDFTASQLDSVLAGNWRSATNSARDVYRHPKATLQFFGIQPDQTVIEITPGSGWCSQNFAPLRDNKDHNIA